MALEQEVPGVTKTGLDLLLAVRKLNAGLGIPAEVLIQESKAFGR